MRLSQEVGMGGGRKAVLSGPGPGRGQREAVNGGAGPAHTKPHLPCAPCWFSQLDLVSLRTPGPVLWPRQPSSGHLLSHSGSPRDPDKP